MPRVALFSGSATRNFLCGQLIDSTHSLAISTTCSRQIFGLASCTRSGDYTNLLACSTIWKLNFERGTFAYFAFDLDVSMMCLNQTLCNP